MSLGDVMYFAQDWSTTAALIRVYVKTILLCNMSSNDPMLSF